MGKVNKKRRGLSEVAAQKSIIPKKKLNPFEIHVNKLKYDVIGRKVKSDKGLPGVSRSNAMKKRKATLLQEYKIKDKNNRFFDRRIGEKNQAMTHDDRIMARFTAERMKIFNKKQIFNLADDEELTHRGQVLSEIEKFDGPQSDDDDMEDSGKLEANFVEGAHFGGGMLKISQDKESKSRKDLIEQLIAESKKRKAEKQRTREQTIELTEKLDSEWQDLLPIVATSKKKPNDIMEVEKPDSYDIVMRQLKFEARAHATEPLKTEEELEELEKEKRAELEAEREKRMKGDLEEELVSSKHRSADDLDDGLNIEEEQEEFVRYDSEGNIVLNADSADLEVERDGDESSSISDDENDEEINLNKNKDEKDEEQENNDNVDEDDEDVDAEDDDSDGDETDDSLSDLRNSEGSNSDEERKNEKSSECDKNVDQKLGNAYQFNKVQDVLPTETNTSTTIGDKRKICSVKLISAKNKDLFLQRVRKKFPNFTSIPEKFEELENILVNYAPNEQYLIITDIMEKNHVRLGDGNRIKLEKLFEILLQYIDDSGAQDPALGFKILNSMGPILYDLVHLSPENTSLHILEVLKDKHENFVKHPNKYPSTNTVIFLKIVSLLYPTSDFRHRIVTPTLVFMCQMLFQCRIKCRRDISMGLFLAAMLLEFTVLSKRFSPGAINFLCGILHLAIPKQRQNVNYLKGVPPFRKVGPYSDLLVLDSKEDSIDDWKMKVSDLSNAQPIDNDFKIRAVATAVSMINEYISNLDHMCALPSIFYCASILLSKVPVEVYPQNIKLEINKLFELLSNLKDKKMQFLIVERKKPKALRLYEPKIETVYDFKRRRPMGREKMEKEKLLHKVKREHKAALREIRRDNAFIAKLKWKETIQSDKKRIEKVKEIFGSAASQLGEIRALERKKKYMK